MARAARPDGKAPEGKLVGQMLRFGIVGGIGFLVDTGVLYLMLAWSLDPYSGRVFSFLAAATATWILNRSFTFRRDSPSGKHPAGEWLAYLGLMVIGGLVNYGIYAAAVALSEPVHRQPVIGVALGAIAGMAINFWTSKTMVFERKTGS
ncbi:GtrA family protein [Dongia sp. agr-C8]